MIGFGIEYDIFIKSIYKIEYINYIILKKQNWKQKNNSKIKRTFKELEKKVIILKIKNIYN